MKYFLVGLVMHVDAAQGQPQLSNWGRGVHVKHRFTVFFGVAAVALAVTSSAFAFDCMRVSSSSQGLQQSATNSGRWLYFDMTDGGNGVAQILDFFGAPTSAASCFQSAYDAAVASDPTLPEYFALGIGVAGGNTNGPGVLAHNNPNSNVLSNGTGIDHFDDTVLPVFLAAAPTCLS